jgi:hypothetical protein
VRLVKMMWMPCLIAVQLGVSAAWASEPLPAPKQYATHNYRITFSTPAGSSYCPLPKDWVGSDHGTTVFLDHPKTCGGAGYPSTGRGFFPASTPRIEVYYGYWVGTGEAKPPHCNVNGWVSLMGQRRAICLGRRDDMITEEIRARYGTDADSQVIVTLVTTLARRNRDLHALRVLTASMYSCATRFKDAAGKAYVVGTGRPCPAGGWF